jgi:predicted CoA-binding protein
MSSTIELNTVLGPEDRDRFQNTRVIREILAKAKTIAIVGLSAEKTKASNMVGSYLQDEGYRVIPVNPRSAGSEILGETVYASLKDIPFPIDVVNVFRPSAEVAGIVDDAIATKAKVVWTQLRIIDLVAAAKAEEAGLKVIVDKCMKMEHGRFGGALHFAGMNTELISARRPGRKGI